MNSIRTFSTSAARNYRAYKAPEFWKIGHEYRALRSSMARGWGRSYHRHSVSNIFNNHYNVIRKLICL